MQLIHNRKHYCREEQRCEFLAHLSNQIGIKSYEFSEFHNWHPFLYMVVPRIHDKGAKEGANIQRGARGVPRSHGCSSQAILAPLRNIFMPLYLAECMLNLFCAVTFVLA